MKRFQLALSVAVAVAFVFWGLKHVDKAKTTSEISDWTPPPDWGAPPDLSSETEDTRPVSLTLEDLPPLVAAKYQAIYQAAIERDYDKLATYVDFYFDQENSEFFEKYASLIVSALQTPVEFSPFILGTGVHAGQDIEAYYAWYAKDVSGGPMDGQPTWAVRIRENGEVSYIGFLD